MIIGNQWNVFFGFMGLGLLCMIIIFFGDDMFYICFWMNYLYNFVFFMGIVLMLFFILFVFIIVLVGWYILIKCIWEVYFMFLILGLILMVVVVIVIVGYMYYLYYWIDVLEVVNDLILNGKFGFLNFIWFFVGMIIIMGIWIFFVWKMWQLFFDEDKNGDVFFEYYCKIWIYLVVFFFIVGFFSVVVIWFWIMFIDVYWYFMLFVWYIGVSWFVVVMVFIIVLIVYLKGKGYLQNVMQEYLYDFGKYLFVFSIFWIYLWFFQYMLIWYGNVGEEIVYFQEWQENYFVFFYGNLLLNFIVFFFVLMCNDIKCKYGIMVFVFVVVFFGYWWDFFQMIKFGV